MQAWAMSALASACLFCLLEAFVSRLPALFPTGVGNRAALCSWDTSNDPDDPDWHIFALKDVGPLESA